MKKAYSKPELYIENFQLTQSIADRCGAKSSGGALGTPGHLSKDVCGWELGTGFILWASEGYGCTELVDADEYGGICYNNPDGAGIFAS